MRTYDVGSSASTRIGREDLSLLHEIAIKAVDADSHRELVRFAIDRTVKAHRWDAGHAYLLRRLPTPRYLPSSWLWRGTAPGRLIGLRRATLRSGFAPGEGAIGTASRRKNPLWIDNVTAAHPPIRFTSENLGVGSGLLIPIVISGEATAVAVLEFYSINRRRPSVARMELATSLGAMIGRVFEREHTLRKLAESREAEQRRIGRELHDTVSQELTGITMLGERLCEELEESGSPDTERVRNLVEHVSEARAKVHALSRGLLPVEIDSDGLGPALEYLAARAREVHGIECHVECTDGLDVGDATVANHLVRIAQESIQNATKHAETDRVEIFLSERDGRITLIVADDGVGFSPSRRKPGLGLQLMRQRAAAIGGELTVTSRKGAGTRIKCICRP